MHILVIEDEAQLCSSIAEGLRLDGYEVDTCMDGNEGLDLCRQNHSILFCLTLIFQEWTVFPFYSSFALKTHPHQLSSFLPELKFRIRWKDLI